MSTRREQILPEVPSLTSLYGQAVARSARLMVRRPGPIVARLPEISYRVDDVRVDRAQLAAYQHLLGEAGTDTLPAGYVHVLGFPVAVAVMAREDFPLPLMGMVHVANQVQQRHPVHADDVLTVRAWAQNLRAHRSGTQVDLVTEVGQADGLDVLWRGVSSYLAKGKPLKGLALVESADGARPARADGRDADAPLPAVTASWRLGASTGRRYADVSGDRNPIHLSGLSAKLFGFKRAIAHGMYTASRALATVGPARPDAFVWDVEFLKPVLLPGQVAINLTPAEGATSYLGWDPRSQAVHFAGSVRPLP
ncbi:MaoC/PaaZ C-terminal domain-containing protein [Occultella aeris]|uniref:MaoC like domain protein n=1 Tax=Occultella aeris TaxID=2761496 RepID=A0A7M4DEV7_9MICO|nr:MaoC/PaaZ C-terminal domain-containing protein [Occultella aeris]VZO35450.1 MaoC like domain protein [Occultella aeris]